MRIIATQIQAKDLEPGDLFSNIGQEYWDNVEERQSLGEKVYIRTTKQTPLSQAEELIYKITIGQ